MLLSQFIVLDHVDSTNNYIAKLAKRGIIPHGAVVLSYDQQNGKGQRESGWIGESGKNLTLSIYLEHQNKEIKDLQYLTYAVSLGILDLLKAHGIEAKIKWPNDLLVDDKKITGILIENKIGEIGWKSSIIGIGINVNQHFEKQKDFSPISMTELLNEELSVEALAFELLEKIDERHLLFEDEKYETLKNDYLKALWRINEPSMALINNVVYEVIIRGVSSDGKLQVEWQEAIHSFDLKEIKFIY